MRIYTLILLLISFNCLSTRTKTTTNSKWLPLLPGIKLSYDSNYVHHPSVMKLSNGLILKGSIWNVFLKKFVLSFPQQYWELLLEGLSRYHLSYDEVEQVIHFSPLRYVTGPYMMHSCICLKGSIRKNNVSAFLVLQYHGNSYLFCEKVKIVADDFMWETRLKFYRENTIKVWEYAFLNLNEVSLRGIVNNIVTSKKAIVRFSGGGYFSDLIVSDRMKTDILAMLKIMDFINSSHTHKPLINSSDNLIYEPRPYRLLHRNFHQK